MARIGILTGGGDCAGLNAVIASIVKTGVPKGHEFVGFLKSWEGVLNPMMYRPLDIDAVRGISHLGGTVLGTVNHGRFAGKVGTGDANAIPAEVLAEAKQNVAQLGLDGLIVIGGDGTLSAALQLAQTGVNIIGVPKTIDNDLQGTDVTFGYNTAVNVAVEALDKIHTTAASHDRVFFVECMGRHAGWIALDAGLAANANAILLPEFPVDIQSLVDFLEYRTSRRGSAIVVVAEGIRLPQEVATNHGVYRAAEKSLAGVSNQLMAMVEAARPGRFEMRNVVLGHTQRGGTPSADDRILAKRYGVAALEAFEAGQWNSMVRLHNGRIETVSIAEATGELKRVTPEAYQLHVAQSLGVYVNNPR